jgi:hypothetical protein
MYRCASGTFDRYDGGMRWHNPGPVRRPPGFVEPCLPSVAYTVPIGPQWAYEIKHGGIHNDHTGKYHRTGSPGIRRAP